MTGKLFQQSTGAWINIMKNKLDEIAKIFKIGIAILVGFFALAVWLSYGLSKLVGITGIHL